MSGYLLCLQCQFNKNLLQFFIYKVDAELFKTIFLQKRKQFKNQSPALYTIVFTSYAGNKLQRNTVSDRWVADFIDILWNLRSFFKDQWLCLKFLQYLVFIKWDITSQITMSRKLGWDFFAFILAIGSVIFFWFKFFPL